MVSSTIAIRHSKSGSGSKKVSIAHDVHTVHLTKPWYTCRMSADKRAYIASVHAGSLGVLTTTMYIRHDDDATNTSGASFEDMFILAEDADS